MISVQIACRDKMEAKKIANILLDKKLIVCANMFPVESMYLWNGKQEKNNEFLIVAKTLQEKLAALEKEVKGVHSYDVPFIGILDERTMPAVDEWIRKEL